MSETIDFLKELNPSQREAVEQTDGPIMIVAGAGSGKTRVLTYRLAYILQQKKATPWELLALTFTNKAAKEMRERIEKLIGPQAKNIQMGTFHSVFSKILRSEADKLGFISNFTIYDEEDAVNLIKTIEKELRIDDTRYKPRSVKAAISSAKNNLVNARTYAAQYAADEYTKIIAKVFEVYSARLLAANAMDFDDLLVNMVTLFDKFPDALYKYQHKFKYVMVDEYQDTNYAQYIITRKLAAIHRNICVVGDDAQSIYSFRGATIENILNFQKDYPEAKVIKLEQNYRSTETIVAAANSIIANNQRQLQKNVFTQNEKGELIRILNGYNEQDEALKVVDSIREQKMVRGLYNKDIAILYRTNAQSRAMEDALRRAGVVYKIFGGTSFYKRKEVKDVLAYLRLCLNPSDEEALKRVINYPVRGIGQTSLDKISELSKQYNMPMWDVLTQAEAMGLGRSAKAVEAFVEIMEKMMKFAQTQTAFETVSFVARESGILKDLHKEKNTEDLARWENVQELINAAREHTENEDVEDPSLAGFLSTVSLFSDLDTKEEGADHVTLMTVHSAKGLEFKSVYLVGLEDGLFPSSMSMNSRQEMEEERRLFYVAVTRAEKYLTISYAKQRFRYNSLESCEPSRFIDEIAPEFIHSTKAPKEKTVVKNPTTATGPSVRLISINKAESKPAAPITSTLDLKDLSVGLSVEHEKFGVGTIESIEGANQDARIVVNFKITGRKTLILKFAKLRIVG